VPKRPWFNYKPENNKLPWCHLWFKQWLL
jgi:hypothetical protein